MALTNVAIANRLGTILPAPNQVAVASTGPTTGDIGADGATPTKAEEMRVFDLTATVGLSGDALVLAIPNTLQLHGSNPLNAGVGHTGLGLDISVTPLNAPAVGAGAFVTQSATQVTLTFTGPSIAPGGAVGTVSAAEFFAQMPGNNAASVGVGVAVSFPQAGPVSGLAPVTAAESGVPTGTRFTVVTTGVYQISWQVSVTEAGQLALHVDGAIQAATTASRAQGTTQIVNTVLLSLTAGQVVDLRNPAGNATALTITPADGNLTHPVGATIVFQLLGTSGGGGAAAPATYRVVMSSMHSLIR